MKKSKPLSAKPQSRFIRQRKEKLGEVKFDVEKVSKNIRNAYAKANREKINKYQREYRAKKKLMENKI